MDGAFQQSLDVYLSMLFYSEAHRDEFLAHAGDYVINRAVNEAISADVANLDLTPLLHTLTMPTLVHHRPLRHQRRAEHRLADPSGDPGVALRGVREERSPAHVRGAGRVPAGGGAVPRWPLSGPGRAPSAGRPRTARGRRHVKIVGGHPRLSASDLAYHLGCRYLTALDLAAAEGRIDSPMWRDPALAVLQERGFEHEQAYLDHLAGAGAAVTRLDAGDDEPPASAFERTVEAMRRGDQVIVQATLVRDRWLGRADILTRVPAPSALGAWSYEVTDTKLARETRGSTMLQLCLYSDIVGTVQERRPEHMHVVTPGRDFAPETYRVDDFMAYYRFVRARLERAVDEAGAPGAPAGDLLAPAPGGLYPEPVELCGICRWWSTCDRRRRADDHLSLVAGISRSQRVELGEWGVGTMAGLALLPLPLERRPARGSREGIVRVREQARVQVEGRSLERPVHELLEREPGQGLLRLPAPSAGDVFLDLEGDAFVGTDGLEYLFGWVVLEDGTPRYRSAWALDRAGERAAFEAWVDALMARWAADPDLHVYHFAPYEPAALKRLMGRYATREAEIDRLLRAGRFVDLHAVTRHALRASVEKYSIKDLEPFYGFARELALGEARPTLRAVEHALELGRADLLDAPMRAVVEAYNRDDCVSTLALRDWLESLRAELEAAGESMPRPPADPAGEAPEEVGEREARIAALAARLAEGVPDDPAARMPEAHARWLLAHLLDWHRREDKAKWWEYFRLLELPDEELLDERGALAGLEFVERVETRRRSEVHRYRFPAQETTLRFGDELHAREVKGAFGHAVNVDPAARTVDVLKGPSKLGVHPSSVFEHTHFHAGTMADALERIGRWAAEHGADAPGSYRAARDLLLRRPPRLAPAPPPGTALTTPGEDGLAAARRLALALDGGVLAIQGPPGAGKTYTGARMIVELVRAGRRVGVTANSHKVIRHLLEEVVASGRGGRRDARRASRRWARSERTPDSTIVETDDNAAVAAALANGTAQVAGGTSWLWSREDMHEAVDVLVVDEAGQLSLANALAVSQGARSLVLLGDPRQLDQPQQGSHPDGCGISALEHLLDGRLTIPDDRGLFLAETWRLHPALCEYTSEMFYESRLRPRSGLERQTLASAPLAGAGPWLLPVEHEGCRNRSPEEVAAVALLIERTLASGATWTDAAGATHPLTLDDILVVAPFNAQVADLAARMPGLRVGTVDKFQGQQAPLVIYSMTTSDPEDAPRGMEFLYSLNRLNVATSRARCACVLVANPRLFEPECRTPQQMRLANAFCRYLELARAMPAL